MKKNQFIFSAVKIIILAFLCLTVLSCKKDKEEVNEDLVIDDNVFNQNYEGALTVNFSNQMPQFSVQEGMAVEIDTLGFVDIEPGTLQYSGETLVSDDSKIERNGQWTLEPLGHIIVEGGVAYIKIDAQINIDYDETKVYAKDNNNNWILVTEYAFSGMPNSDLGFNFSDAVNGGTTSNVVDQFGNIEWTLILYIAD